VTDAITVLEALRPRAGLEVSVAEQYAAVNVAIERLALERESQRFKCPMIDCPRKD
jgi:hypothetical protein